MDGESLNRNRKRLLLGVAANILTLLIIHRKKQLEKKRRKVWTKMWIQRRLQGKGILSMLNEELLVEDPPTYRNFLRLKKSSFEKLLSKVEPYIKKQETNMRESISTTNRLETTCFLVTGEMFRSLMYCTHIHESSISKFVPEVCRAIYCVLQDEYLNSPSNTSEWCNIAEGYDEMWQFPHCIGTLDGRHIKFRPPVSSGSYYYNYKGNHSIVLLAMADSAYKFIYSNVGVNGRVSDGGVFQNSGLFEALEAETLNLPQSKQLPGRIMKVPYVIVADDAFPLSYHVMKPYPCRGLTYEQKVFNYRLSRARRMIESAFGILANRFRVLLNPIQLIPEKVEIITLCCLCLHNYLISETGKAYTSINEDDTISPLNKAF